MNDRQKALKLAATLLSWHDDNVEHSPKSCDVLRESAIMLREQADHIKEQENLNGWAKVVKLKHELSQVRTASRQHKERKEFLEIHCDRLDDQIDRLKDAIQELEQQL